MAALLQEPTMLIWLENIKRHSDEEVELWCNVSQDNEPAHIPSQVLSKMLHHPPYSPDLAPSDCFQTKGIHKGPKFVDDENVIHTASGWLEDQDQEFFYSRIWALEFNAWPSVILLEETILESDKIPSAYCVVKLCAKLQTLYCCHF